MNPLTKFSLLIMTFFACIIIVGLNSTQETISTNMTILSCYGGGIANIVTSIFILQLERIEEPEN